MDERIFSELTLDFELTPLKWIEPKPKESIRNYATRFAEQIDPTVPFSIIGISFGGIMAIELNKIINPSKILLISSASSKSDIPLIFRILGQAGFLKLVPDFLMKPPSFIANWFFGVSEPEHKQILKQIMANTDVDFLRWATNAIAKWDNSQNATNTVRIHGSSDRLLNYSKKEDVIVIPNAGHFMIVNRADELSKVINQNCGTRGNKRSK